MDVHVDQGEPVVQTRHLLGEVTMLIPLLVALTLGQATPSATMRVTVVDPSGAVIVGAHVTIAPTRPTPSGTVNPPAATMETSSRGEATFSALDAGRYTIHVESPGFAPYDARDVRVRSGDNHRDVKLAIAAIAETVQVGRDPQERASDPRSDAFATVLGQAEINELPDDPDEMEQMLRDMAGPGATFRVNGFRGGKLPPKSQIQQIRFRRNMFAADAHEAGFMSVDITTKPGFDDWRGATNIGFRGAALEARNAFAPVKGDEERGRYGFSLNGPLQKGRTSLAVSADGFDAFDSKTIVAALPTGYFADSIRRPNDRVNFSARIEHGLTASQVLRAEFQRNHTFSGSLGVGDFDLPERGYDQTLTENVFRLSTSGSLRKSLFNDFHFQFRRTDTVTNPLTTAPAMLVLNAFNTGGAQLSGSLGSDEVEVSDDLDVSVGKHAMRAGFLVDGGRYRTDELRNTGGTFTFASLDAYAAGQPTTFSRSVGNPHVEVSQYQAGLYFQDDYRARKNLTISGGLRQEVQTAIGGVHLGPRGGIVWSPFKNGKTTVRAGGGVFYDWFDAQSYEQTVQLDGTHQQVATILQPCYPEPSLGGRALALPPGRVLFAPDRLQPEIREVMAGMERQLPGDVRVGAMYIRRRGLNQLRGVNINAPLADGFRPDPSAGTITDIEPIASSQFDGLLVNANYANPQRRVFVSANYSLSRSIDEADTPFSLPASTYDLAAERGPAANDSRHRFMSLANFPLPSHFRIATAVRLQSGLPFNITTGRDDNGDTVSNDRPAGMTRNLGRGTAQVDIGARLSWSIGFGTKPPAGAGGPQVRIIRGGDADPLGSMGGADGLNKRYTMELFAQAYNLTNHLNATNFSGVLTSPFFGQPTSAAAPRRMEVGARLTF
jgi:hypothetical protein